MGLRHRHLFRLDPKHDVIHILMEQTQNERGRIRAAFRKMVYDAFLRDHWSARQAQSGKKRAGCRFKKKGKGICRALPFNSGQFLAKGGGLIVVPCCSSIETPNSLVILMHDNLAAIRTCCDTKGIVHAPTLESSGTDDTAARVKERPQAI